MKIKTHQSTQFEVALAHPVVGFVQMAIECQQKRDGMFRHLWWRATSASALTGAAAMITRLPPKPLKWGTVPSHILIRGVQDGQGVAVNRSLHVHAPCCGCLDRPDAAD